MADSSGLARPASDVRQPWNNGEFGLIADEKPMVSLSGITLPGTSLVNDVAMVERLTSSQSHASSVSIKSAVVTAKRCQTMVRFM
jgi:hypothetical protein